MKVLLRLGWRDLSRNLRFTLLFILNLALGLTGITVIGSFSDSLHRHLADNLREILTADLVLQSSRPLTEREVEISRAITPPGSITSEQVSFYSMVKGGKGAKLAQIVAVDGSYPLYGTFRYAEPLSHAQVIARLQQGPHLLMSRETAATLGLRLGDILNIGQAGYDVAYLFDQAPDSEFTALALAPKIYLGLPQVRDSGLIRFGSRITYKHFIRLPASADAAQVSARLNTALSVDSTMADIRIATTLDVNRRLGRVVEYFRTYLGLAGMVSLFLAGLAAAYLFWEYLQPRLKTTAILLSLGASHLQCLALFAGQSALLGLVAACGAIIFAWLLLPLFGHLFTGLVPPDLHLVIQPVRALLTVLIGGGGSLLFCLPVYLRICTVHPLFLLQENATNAAAGGKRPLLLLLVSLVPALSMLALLATVVSGSLTQGAEFTIGLVALVLVFALIAGVLFTGCRRWSQTSNLTRRIVWRNLHRNRLPATAVFVAVATVMLFVNLVPQIEKGLLEEIGRPEEMELPVFFLVDIQEEQQQPLRAFFQGSGHLLSTPAPMVRGRINSVNSVPFAQWRRQHQGTENAAFQRTEFNFSSREQLDPSETVVKGQSMSTLPWSGATNQPFEISMEQQFAERLGVTIGDRLVVDIQGMMLAGKIVNLRKVRWNSFQPNFFMLLQKGVLDEAPKTYLTSVSRIAPEEKQEVMNRLVGLFPNISVIDVTGTVEQLEDISGRLTRSLREMAWLAMATGLVAVIAIARQEALRREREINLLRVLGAGIGRIRMIVMLEFGFLGITAAFAAILLSYGGAYAVAWRLFDHIWRFQWQSGLLLLIAAPLICAAAALIATESVVRRKPVALLG